MIDDMMFANLRDLIYQEDIPRKIKIVGVPMDGGRPALDSARYRFMDTSTHDVNWLICVHICGDYLFTFYDLEL